MANIKAKINNQQDLRIKSNIVGAGLSQLKDVDVSNLKDGSVLVYSTENSSWEATTILQKQTVEAGEY